MRPALSSLLFAYGLASLTSSSARACLVMQPLSQERKAAADTVFIGRMLTIGVPSCSGVGVILPETIKKHFKCVTKEASNGLGRKVTLKECSHDLPIPAMITPGEEDDLPWIVSDLCSPAYLGRAE